MSSPRKKPLRSVAMMIGLALVVVAAVFTMLIIASATLGEDVDAGIETLFE